MDGEHMIKKHIKEYNEKLQHFKMTDINQKMGSQVKGANQTICELCKATNGQNQYQIMKIQNEYFLINKQFLHPKFGMETGRLMLKIFKYKLDDIHEENLFDCDKLKDLIEIEINSKV